MGYISLYDFYSKIIPINEFIIQASEISGSDKNDDTRYSIGLSCDVLNLSNKEKINMQLGKHENLVFSSFSLFSHVFGSFQTLSDKFRCVHLHSDAF